MDTFGVLANFQRIAEDVFGLNRGGMNGVGCHDVGWGNELMIARIELILEVIRLEVLDGCDKASK